jgi:hypothetical protein
MYGGVIEFCFAGPSHFYVRRKAQLFLQGAGKKITGGPRGGWVGQSKKRDGVRFIFLIFFIVFLNSPHRETPKNVIKQNQEKSVLDFWSNFLQKLFDTMFFAKRFFCVFELPSLKNTRKRDKKKSRKN